MVHDLILDIGKTLDPLTVRALHVPQGLNSRSVESTAWVMFFQMRQRDVGHALPHLENITLAVDSTPREIMP